MIVLFAVFLYTPIMAMWAINIAASRRSRHLVRITCIALLLPIVTEGMEGVMAFSTMDADEVHGLALYTPTLLLVVYAASSIGTVIWAYCGGSSREQRGFPIEPNRSVSPGTNSD